MRVLIIAACGCGALAVGGPFRAQDECRKPTADEQAAVLKFATAERQTVLPPLERAGWKANSVKSVFDGFTVANRVPAPPRPLSVCTPQFEVTLELDPQSPRGAELQRQANALAQQGTADATKQMFHTIELGKLEIRTDTNSPYIREAFTTPAARLDVPGVPLAYTRTVAASSNVDSVHQTTTVCVGNWRNWGTDTYVTYPFVHKPLTPFIENACVEFLGLPEVVDAAVKQIDWTPLNASLTK